jgi:hypothetical protein
MQKRSIGALVMSCALMVIVTMAFVSAQRGGGAPGRGAGPGDGIRHLVYIGTPGDGGTDN